MIAINGTDFKLVLKKFLVLSHSGYYVYRWKRGEEMLYVGSTHNVFSRFGSHKFINNIEPIQDIDVIEFFPCTDKVTMLVTERSMIFETQPKYNIRSKRDRTKLTKEEQRIQINEMRALHGLGPMGEAAQINAHKI